MISASSKLVIEAILSASRFLKRDYRELELLQSSGKDLDKFVEGSIDKYKSNINYNLSNHGLTSNFYFENEEKKDFNGNYIKLLEIDSINLLKRASNIFSVSGLIYKLIESNYIPVFGITSFPETGEFMYAEIGKGAYIEKFTNQGNQKTRLLVSKLHKSNPIICVDNFSLALDYQNKYQKIAYINYSDSMSYSLKLFCQGKIDLCIFKHNNLNQDLIKLFISESKGKFEIYKDFIEFSNKNITVNSIKK